jgi:hypothetical protein
MELLLLSGALLCLALAVATCVAIADTIGDWFSDTHRYTKLYHEKRKLQSDVKALKTELQLWKKACDNLDKELVDEVSKKSNLS